MKRVAIVSCVMFLLVGCAGIPTDGPIHRIEDRELDSQSAVRYAPAGPVKDATPQQIVSGFLDAMLAYPVTTGVAASFLTPEGARQWKSSAGVIIYDAPVVGSATRTAAGAQRTVELSVRAKAELDVQGRYSELDRQRSLDLVLTQVEGQWRISNPPDGFLVNEKFFADYYRPFSLYYFDRPAKRLVPVPIYLPIGDQLPTSMMTSLLRGPRGALSGYARSYIPKNAQLRTAVTVRADGLAEVELKQDIIALPNFDQERLSAQIVSTLAQINGVTGVRITGAGTEVSPQGSSVQVRADWAAFAPPTTEGTFFAIAADKVVRMSGRSVGELSGAWGKDARGAQRLAVRRDEEQLAVVSDNRSKLELGGLAKDLEPVLAQFNGSALSNPVFDDREQAWAFDRPAGQTRLRRFTADGSAEVAIGSLASSEVESFAISPGQSRYAVIVRDGPDRAIYVGGILADKDDVVQRFSEPRRLDLSETNIESIGSIVWQREDVIAFLGTKPLVGDQVFRARIDGSTIQGGSASDGPLLPTLKSRGLAVSGGLDPVQYVVDADGRMWWQTAGNSWQIIEADKLSAPTYSG